MFQEWGQFRKQASPRRLPTRPPSLRSSRLVARSFRIRPARRGTALSAERRPPFRRGARVGRVGRGGGARGLRRIRVARVVPQPVLRVSVGPPAEVRRGAAGGPGCSRGAGCRTAGRPGAADARARARGAAPQLVVQHLPRGCGAARPVVGRCLPHAGVNRARGRDPASDFRASGVRRGRGVAAPRGAAPVSRRAVAALLPSARPRRAAGGTSQRSW